MFRKLDKYSERMRNITYVLLELLFLEQLPQRENSIKHDRYLPIYINIHFNMNDLNTPIKRQRLQEWIKKKNQLYVVYKKSILHIITQVKNKGFQKVTPR